MFVYEPSHGPEEAADLARIVLMERDDDAGVVSAAGRRFRCERLEVAAVVVKIARPSDVALASCSESVSRRAPTSCALMAS
jgi:hypothetical protein